MGVKTQRPPFLGSSNYKHPPFIQNCLEPKWPLHWKLGTLKLLLIRNRGIPGEFQVTFRSDFLPPDTPRCSVLTGPAPTHIVWANTKGPTPDTRNEKIWVFLQRREIWRRALIPLKSSLLIMAHIYHLLMMIRRWWHSKVYQNGGGWASFHERLRLAKSTYIIFANTDQTWSPWSPYKLLLLKYTHCVFFFFYKYTRWMTIRIRPNQSIVGLEIISTKYLDPDNFQTC